MKKYFLLSTLFFLFIITANSQNAGLTKSETIDYINKILAETNGLIMEIDNPGYTGSENFKKKFLKFQYANVRFNNNKIEITYDNLYGYNNLKSQYPQSYKWESQHTYSFDVSKIKSINISIDTIPERSPLLFSAIEFSANIVIETSFNRYSIRGNWGDWRQVSDSKKYAFAPVLKDDFEKLKKAFLYLRDLVKAEDPFAN
jgi:hypothetical protein